MISLNGDTLTLLELIVEFPVLQTRRCLQGAFIIYQDQKVANLFIGFCLFVCVRLCVPGRSHARECVRAFARAYAHARVGATARVNANVVNQQQ